MSTILAYVFCDQGSSSNSSSNLTPMPVLVSQENLLCKKLKTIIKSRKVEKEVLHKRSTEV